jgi:hypothetical protein
MTPRKPKPAAKTIGRATCGKRFKPFVEMGSSEEIRLKLKKYLERKFGK